MIFRDQFLLRWQFASVKFSHLLIIYQMLSFSANVIRSSTKE